MKPHIKKRIGIALISWPCLIFASVIIYALFAKHGWHGIGALAAFIAVTASIIGGLSLLISSHPGK